MLRRDCRSLLYYAGKNFCQLVWKYDILAEPRELLTGCDTSGRCPNYNPLMWKREQLPDAEREALEADEEGTKNVPPPKTN